ncbi:trichohyalin-like [Anarrhichthys ocellatus]|uniref:trichohyalin-like n=1 Tax=Anarrhichthys ocellatus TaxID=433405 RepID=UPI0012ED977A|nr:trichohyalin-like [Anarrhichthys ocellatus]
MSQLKHQIDLDFKKRTIQAKAEKDEMVQMRKNIQKQKKGLEIRLEEVKRERREMEVLKCELEIEKRQNQQMIRKGIQKEQEGKKMWAEVKIEEDAFKRETQKRKKELDQRLERINRERDELEIMKIKMQREKDVSKGRVGEWFIQFQSELEPDEVQEKRGKSIKLSERKGLIKMSNVVNEKDVVKEKWKPNSVKEYGDLKKLKTDMTQKREDQKDIYDIMTKEKLDLDLMKSDMKKQMNLLE